MIHQMLHPIAPDSIFAPETPEWRLTPLVGPRVAVVESPTITLYAHLAPEIPARRAAYLAALLLAVIDRAGIPEAVLVIKADGAPIEALAFGPETFQHFTEHGRFVG